MAPNPSPHPEPASSPARESTTSSEYIRKSNKHILRTLKAPDNPIAHSISPQSDLVIQSASTGHQNGGGRGQGWLKERTRQLGEQAAKDETGILKNVVVYVNGYTGETSIRELKVLVQTNGGTLALYPSAKTTHILATNLSGSKTQAFLKASNNRTKVVAPEWVVESCRRGVRLPESRFTVIRSETQPSLLDFASDPIPDNCDQKLGSSPGPSRPAPLPPPSKRSKKRAREATPPVQDAPQDSADEWDMPPSAQQQR